MSNHEIPGSDDPREQPEHDKLPDYEIDLTGVIDQTGSLIDVIGDAIVEAGPDGEVPEWGARAMARLLANRDTDQLMALHHFAATGHFEYEQVAQELAELWRVPGLPDLHAEAVNRLGTYLLAVHRERRDSGQPEHSEETRARIAELGPAYAAFLELADVTEDTNGATFHESYYASFATVEEIVDHVAATHEVWQLLEDASLSHLASPDARLLIKLARQRWDIVWHEDRYYLFEK